MKKLTPELIAKAKAAKSAEELLELSKANGVELTEEEANTYFAQLNTNGAISDDELDLVAGGGGCPDDEEEEPKYQEGDTVRFTDGTKCTCGCSTASIGRSPYMRYGAYLRCTNCSTIILDHIPYDYVVKC